VKKNFLIVLSLIALTIFFEGCSTPIPVQQERSIASDRVIKRLEANRRKIKNFAATGSIYIKTNEIEATSSFQVELKKPDSVRVSFFGPFGIDLASALITPKNFEFYDAINNTLYKGSLKAGTMKQILKVEMTFDELVDFITGSVNLTDKLSRDANLVEPTDDTYKLSYVNSEKQLTENIFVKVEELQIMQYQKIDSKGKSLFDTKFSGFEKYDDVPFPKKINVTDSANDQKINVEYRTINLNKEIGKLKIEIPEDAKIIIL